MKNFIISILLLLVSCSQQAPDKKVKNSLPDNIELSDIVKNIIEIDSLDCSDGNYFFENFQNYIRKYDFPRQHDTLEPPCPPPVNYRTIESISLYTESTLGLKLNEEDSIFLTLQIDSSDFKTIDSLHLPKIKLINKEQLRDESIDYHSLYMFYTPLFTMDKNYVIVEYDIIENTRMDFHNNYGLIVILKKENGKWTKVHSNIKRIS